MRLSIVVTAMYRPHELKEVVAWLAHSKYPKILCVDKYMGTDEVKRLMNNQVVSYSETLRNFGWKVFVQNTNLGCKGSIEFAISCGLNGNHYCVIIEDDLTFHEDVIEYFVDAFNYADAIQMRRYFVNGCNFSIEKRPHITRFFHGWGWGIGRLTWHDYLRQRQYYQWDLRDLRLSEKSDFTAHELSALESFAKLARLSNLPRSEGGIDTWDYQFAYHCLLNDIKGIVPSKSVFANRGFDHLATHTNGGISPQLNHNQYTPPLIDLALGLDTSDFSEVISAKRCRLCSGSVKEMFAIESDLGFPLIFSQCNACDLVQVVDVNWIDDAYKADIDQYDQGAVVRSLNIASFVGNVLAAIDWKKSLGADSARISAIDYGAGSGLLARLLRDMSIDCWSYDKYQSAPLNPGFHLKSLPNQRFQVLLLIEVIEHISDFEVFLQNIRDIDPVLIVISTELYTSQDASWGYFTPFHGQHISIFTENTVKWLAEALKLNIFVLSSGLQVLGRHSLAFNRVDNFFGLKFLFERLSENSFNYAIEDQLRVKQRKRKV